MLFLFTGPFNLVALGLGEAQVLLFDTHLCLLLFIQHSIMARKSFRQWLERFLPVQFTGALYVVTSGVVVLVLVVFWQESDYSLVTLQSLARLFMRAVIVVAIAGVAWTIWALGFFVNFRLQPLMDDLRGKQSVPEREYKEPRFLTTQEYRALLRACSHQTRDAAIIELILQTGIRLSEVARLTTDDIKLPSWINRDPNNTGSIFIKGKGRKQRTLPLNYRACRDLKAWLKVRPNIDDPALFTTKFRQPMWPRAIQNIVT